jgi:cysteinyl-tRNA synthetase
MNVPVACAQIWTILKDGTLRAEEKYEAVERADAVLALGLLIDDRAQELVSDIDKGDVRIRLISSVAPEDTLVEKVVELVGRRTEARAAKNFAAADSIRAELSSLGVAIKDLPGGIAECRVAKA